MSEMKLDLSCEKSGWHWKTFCRCGWSSRGEATYRFKAIIGSIPEVGLVEPLVVYPQKDSPGKYMLKTDTSAISH